MVFHQKLSDTKEDQLCLAGIHYLRSHFQEATDIYKKLLLENRDDLALNVYVGGRGGGGGETREKSKEREAWKRKNTLLMWGLYRGTSTGALSLPITSSIRVLCGAVWCSEVCVVFYVVEILLLLYTNPLSAFPPPSFSSRLPHRYVAMCYYKLDYYDVSLEILAVYLSAHPDSAIAINLKACNHFRLYNGKAAEGELKVRARR